MPPEASSAAAADASAPVAVASEPSVEDIEVEGEGPLCSIFMDDATSAIPDDVLSNKWSPYLDKVDTMDGLTVRACSKGAKQVATLGPASATDEMIERLFLAGVDVFRLNFSHGEHEEKTELISRIRALEYKYMFPICILADMQGPKQRCGKFAAPEGVELRNGQTFRFDLDDALGDEHRAQLPHPEILIALTEGKTLLLDDGKIRMRVTRSACKWQGQEMTVDGEHPRPSADVAECPPFIECVVEVGGRLSARKGVNTPDVVLPISPITPKDRKDIEFACQADVDWIALSFVQRHEDMEELRSLVSSSKGSTPKILAKVEKPSAVEDLAKILEVSDGVMVARGDLGVEMNPEEVPFVQKEMIRQAHASGKPVIVATQMLESMIASPTPTRAECSDVANAILDGCDAVMLSGETAAGKHPTECVEMQRRVIRAAERQGDAVDGGKGHHRAPPTGELSPTGGILASASTLAEGLDARAIICFTATGSSISQLAKMRPGVPILAICPCLETARWLSLLRNVYATSDPSAQALAHQVATNGPYSVRFSDAMEVACRLARTRGIALKPDDQLVVCARLPLFTPGDLNCIRISSATGPRVADGYGRDVDALAANAGD